MGKIIVIGRNTIDDFVTLDKAGEWLAKHRGRKNWAKRIFRQQFDTYDMTTMPEKGDAIDAIDEDTELVIALHIYGIDQIPGRHLYGMNLPYTYCKRNGELLQICMKLRIPLICWGDQPWLGLENRTRIHENSLWIYEPFA